MCYVLEKDLILAKFTRTLNNFLAAYYQAYMKLHSLISSGICALGVASLPVFAQQFDVTKVQADPTTFIFDDGKHTVQQYIYEQLETKSKCCGNDAIYLEVKIDPTGSVLSAKSLTGKNDCYKNSVVDIVRGIRWNTATIKTAKAVYFELKPLIACRGNPDDNTYAPIPLPGGATASTPTPNNDQARKEAEERARLEAEKIRIAAEQRAREEERAREEANKKNTQKETTTVVPTNKDSKVANNKKGDAKNAETDSLALPNPKYISTGDKKPDSSHVKTTLNTTGPRFDSPQYSGGEQAMMIYVKSSLRKAGICGLAQTLTELTIDGSGTVVSYRVFRANSDEVRSVLPTVIQGMKFMPSSRFKQNFLLEFKTDIDCTGKGFDSDAFNNAPHYFNTGQAGNIQHSDTPEGSGDH